MLMSLPEPQEAPVPPQEVKPSVTMSSPQVTVTYEVSEDVELRSFFGCTCAEVQDSQCPLSEYHGCKPPPLGKDDQSELEENQADTNGDEPVAVETKLIEDEWQQVAIQRCQADMPLTTEAKQAIRHGCFEVIPSMFKRILQHVQVVPQVDVFATEQNTKLPRFWTQHQDAFKQNWSRDTLWICPPFSQLDAVLEKIFHDEAEGILLIPIWKHQPWFHKLERISVTWWDIPQNQPVLRTPSGKLIPIRRDMLLRAVVFNSARYVRDDEPKEGQFVPTNIRTIEWECPTEDQLVILRSVIASAT